MRRLCLGGSVKVFFLGSWPPPPPPTSSWCPGLRRLAWARAGAGSSASLSTPCCQHVNISTGRLLISATYRQVEGAGGGEPLPPEEAGLGLQVGEVVDCDPGAAHAVQGLALVRVLVVVDELRDVLLLLHQSGHLASVLTLLTLAGRVTLLVTLLLTILVTLLVTLLLTILVTMLLTILLVTLLVISLAMQRTSMVLFHRTRNFLTRLS